MLVAIASSYLVTVPFLDTLYQKANSPFKWALNEGDVFWKTMMIVFNALHPRLWESPLPTELHKAGEQKLHHSRVFRFFYAVHFVYVPKWAGWK